MAPPRTGGDHRDRVDDEMVLGLLDAVERDQNVTQRHLARELGIALGLANTYLKRCVRKGLIKMSQAPARRYYYYLTPRGFSEKSRLTATYLSNSFSFFRSARLQCGDLLRAASERGQRKIALIGAGDLAEIAALVATEYEIEIVGVVTVRKEGDDLIARLDGCGDVDAVLVTAMENSRGAVDAAVARFGSHRVHVPALLRVHSVNKDVQRPRAGEAA